MNVTAFRPFAHGDDSARAIRMAVAGSVPVWSGEVQELIHQWPAAANLTVCSGPLVSWSQRRDIDVCAARVLIDSVVLQA